VHHLNVRLAFWDYDAVEEKNIFRQNFCEAEIGTNKAETLARRYGLAWGIEIIAVPTLIKELPQPLRKLIGSMASKDKVLVGLDLQEKED